MPFSIIVILLIFFVIAFRHWLPIRVGIWQVMLAGALVLLATQQVTPINAIKAVNWDVILFLFGVFTLGQAMVYAGIMQSFCQFTFKHVKNLNLLLFLFIFIVGLVSAIFSKDTLAIMAAPIAIIISQQTKVRPNLFLFALCFTIAIGSMITPIGNAQSLLVTVHGDIPHPFGKFAYWMGVPSIINLFVCFFWLRFCFRKDFKRKVDFNLEFAKPIDPHKAWPVYASLAIFMILILYKAMVQLFEFNYDPPIGELSLLACLPIYIFCNNRIKTFKAVDWYTLIFFISSFIVMAAVWHSPFIADYVEKFGHHLQSPPVIISLSAVLSQFISNLPLVELYLTFLTKTNVLNLICLAMGSTIATNIFILSAASNIIVVQHAEKEGINTMTFWRFAFVGIPLAIINLLVYYFWIYFLGY